jgi:DNA transformation protein and related proteins
MPSKNQEFATYCCDLLGTVGPCVLRRMFGGYGISTEGLTVAIMTDLGHGEKLWLKADDGTRAQFEAAGCQRFGYLREGVQRSMNYYSAPEEAMDSPQQMAPWARLALEAALAAASKAPLKKPPKAKVKAKVNAKTKIKANGKPKLATPAAAKKSPTTAR